MKFFGNGLGWTGTSNKNKEQRALEYVNCNVSGALPFFPFSSQYSALSISAVYRAIELISSSVAVLPIKVLINNDEGKNELKTHPVNLLFNDRNTNNLISKFTLIKLLVQSVLMRGNGFCYIERASDGTPIRLRYLEANDVNIVYDNKRSTLYYDVPLINKRVQPNDMIHLLMHSFDGIKGIGVLQNAARSVNIAQASENAAKNFFGNGMNLSGILQVQGPVSQKQREEIRQAWTETYVGDSAGLAILQGNMTYQPVQQNNKDSQMLESRQYSVQDIARFFGINPVLLGDLSKTSYSTLEAIQNDFLVHTLQPYITMIENEFNRKLLKVNEDNLTITLETNEILRVNKDAQATYYTSLLNSAVLSINEVRKELGYNGIGEAGDKHYALYSDTQSNLLQDNETKESNDKE